MNRIAVLLLAFALSPVRCPRAVAQNERESKQPPQFRVDVDFIEVDVIVTDSAGDPVTGLRVEDFELLEDGRTQDIAAFRVIDIPVKPRTPPTESLETDIRSNQTAPDGRVYVLVLDDLHIAPARSLSVQALARQFIESWVGSNDTAIVIKTGGGDLSKYFTGDRASLLETIEDFRGRMLPSRTLTRLQRQQELQQMRRMSEERQEVEQETRREETEGTPLDTLERERGQRALQTLRMLRGVCELLEGTRGRRKAIILVSEGTDYATQDFAGSRDALGILEELRRLTGQAGQSNVAIYPVDPRGLRIDNQPLDQPPGILADPNALATDTRRQHDQLLSLSSETGGVSILNLNNLGRGLERVAADNSRYYLLGYYPGQALEEGEYRRIEVRVKQPNLGVRARKSYVARPPTSRRADDAATAFQSPFPLTGIPLRIFAAPFHFSSPAVRVSVLVDMDIKSFRFTPVEDRLQDQVELTLAAFDTDGNIVETERRMLNLDLKPETHRSALKHGFRTLNGLDLPPGTYSLRVVARESGAHLSGSVFYELEVPNCGKEGAVTGGIFIGSLKETIVPIAAEETEKQGLQFPPTTRRAFSADDQILIQTEICEPPSSSLEVSTYLRGGDGKIHVELSERYDGTDATASSKGVIHRARLPLKKLSPGHYLIGIVARDTVTSREVQRGVAFEIVSPN